MRWMVLLAFLFSSPVARAQKQMAQSPRILNAKTIYFLNKTGCDSVGSETLAELKKWGKYQLVFDRSKAELIFLLSGDPYHGGDILFADGQTGSVDNDGQIMKDPVPNYFKAAPTREAYLFVIDPKTGDNLWSDHHVWGGLLTGLNNVGARLVRKLESQTKH